MKLWEVFRFEVGYQLRRAWTWVYFVALLAISFQITMEGYTENARDGGYFFNAPFVIVSITLVASLMGLLVTAALAGDAAARDVQTRMNPLIYTSPVGKRTYLTGRFLAAYFLTALILMSAQIALLVSAIMPGISPELVGPFQPLHYLGAYVVIALPNAFVTTALLFSIAALSRRAIASYLGAVLLFFASMMVYFIVAGKLGRWELAKMLDPMSLVVLSEVSRTTTPADKNMLSMMLTGSLFLNRAVWLGIALGVLALTHLRFRFDHATTRSWWRRRINSSEASNAVAMRSSPIIVTHVARTFGYVTRARQTVTITAQSFREIALSWGGLILAALGAILIFTGPTVMNHLGVPLLPTTQQMTGFVGHTGEILWMIVPLLTVFYVGELVWRERETGMSEISDAAPVPEWVRVVGKFTGLGLVIVAYQMLLVAGCILIQVQLGYYEFELGLYARIMFGLQLADHLLFVLLAFAVHVIVNQKYAGHMVVIIAYAFTAFASALGVEHNLLVYGSSPGWTYTDMRGFGPSLVPFVWFKLYWGAWALLLAVGTKLFWVRGRDNGVSRRVRSARQRFSRPTAGIVAAAVALILTLGGFVFYNTNVLNDYTSKSDAAERSAEYERRYAQYARLPQPRLTGTNLRVEIYPERRDIEISAMYRLVNMSGVAIDSIHIAPESEVETGPVDFDRPATLMLDDVEHGYRIYALKKPLMPGDSMRLNFTARFKPRGFTNGGIDPAVSASGTYFEGNDWLPAVGYQSDRELTSPGERREHGLPPHRAAVRSLDDIEALSDMTGAERIAFEAVLGTAMNQVAVAPGALRRTWTENGRRYFDYATDVPIRNDFAIYSAAYAVRKARWNDVTIEIFHHPAHTSNLDRMVKSIRASLEYFTARFGPYPHHQVRLVEFPSEGNSLHAAPVNISYQEGFSIFNPDADARQLDFPFAVVAHEMAHQWWGNQVSPADVEGAPLLTESLAWYSALLVVEETYGRDHLQRLLAMMREAYIAPRSRAGVPLLRAYDRFLAYRKGPFVMYALHEYVGAERVNAALQRLLEKHGAAAPPLSTSLDLYRELQAVTPDSLRYLLGDLFEANTFWELEAKRATAEPAEAGTWRVTLELQVRKVVVDSAGAETEVLMDDLVEIGVFAAENERLGEPLYLRMHRVRSGEQRIIVTVPKEPARAGIDPRSLLIDLDPDDSFAEVERQGSGMRPRSRPSGIS